MPEGDTLHRTALGLSRALAGRKVTRFESVYPKLARVDVDRPLAGRTVEEIRAVGKHLLITFSGDLVLRTHMRMNGSWHIYRPGERWQRPRAAMRILIETEGFVAVGFDVPEAELLDQRALARHEVLSALGPDLLAPDFDAAEALRRLRAAGEIEIADALLDQRRLSGIGNAYKSEILFACGISPFTKVSALSDETLARIVKTARRQMSANVPAVAGESGRPANWDGYRRTTGRGNPAERLFVYGRGGKPCRRCGTPIDYRPQGPHARGTYFCPRCQPEPLQGS